MPTYTVACRRMASYSEALAYARQRAAATGERVAIMEKLDAWTAWQVLQWVCPS